MSTSVRIVPYLVAASCRKILLPRTISTKIDYTTTMDLRAEKNKLELVIASSSLFSQRTNDQLIQK